MSQHDEPESWKQANQFVYGNASGYVLRANDFNRDAAYQRKMVCDDSLSLLEKRLQRIMTGTKPIVVCAGETREAKDMNDAQSIAEHLAHQKGADAYILKPVRKVAPKRDVVTTDL